MHFCRSGDGELRLGGLLWLPVELDYLPPFFCGNRGYISLKAARDVKFDNLRHISVLNSMLRRACDRPAVLQGPL